MNIRQFVNRNPAVMVAVVLVLVAVCAWVLWSQAAASSAGKPPKAAYFSIDDGKTWFVDDVAKLPPFEKDGKQAVRVHLFACPGSSDPVAGVLERYTTKGKEVMDRYIAEQKAKPGVPPTSLGEVASLGVNATEVKKPGEDKWTPKSQGLQLMQFKCADGSAGVGVNP